MTEKAKKVVVGYLQLTETEKKEVRDFVQSFENLGYFEKGERSGKLLNESRIMGPTSSGGCPCCGK